MVSNNINSSQKRSYVGVIVEDGNVDRAMRRLKRTMINEKMFTALNKKYQDVIDAKWEADVKEVKAEEEEIKKAKQEEEAEAAAADAAFGSKQEL